MHRIVMASAFLVACAASSPAELADTLTPAPDHPAIGYFHNLEHPPRDPVSVLNRKIRQDLVQLHFEDRGGYLQSVLEALHTYLSPYSDIAALLVFNHQMHMMNLLTRIGWEARAGLHDKP